MGNLFVKSCLLALPLILSACHGQDPFKRESNPIKAYPATQEAANEPYVPGQRPTTPPPAPAPAATPKVQPEPPPCYSIESVQPQAGSELTFTEGVENSHQVVIKLGGPQRVELDIQAERPTDALWRLLSRQGNELKYSLTWKPAKNAPKSSKLNIVYNVKDSEDACSADQKSVSLNLTVSSSGAAAPAAEESETASEKLALTFPDLKNKITFGDKFEFIVLVEDPAATEGKAPDLQSINYLQSSQRAGFLNARPAVTGCDEAGRPVGGNKFEFVCAFNSDFIDGVDKYLNSGREVTAAFAITVVSTANGKTERSTAQNIDVSFPNVSGKQGAKR